MFEPYVSQSSVRLYYILIHLQIPGVNDIGLFLVPVMYLLQALFGTCSYIVAIFLMWSERKKSHGGTTMVLTVLLGVLQNI